MPQSDLSSSAPTGPAGLAAVIDGRVITPADSDYDEARAVWNAMHQARPTIIVQPVSADDVAHALRYATANGLAVAVRGGGHSVAGNGTVDQGLVIDLGARMRG